MHKQWPLQIFIYLIWFNDIRKDSKNLYWDDQESIFYIYMSFISTNVMLKLSQNLLFFHSYYAFMKVECENYLQIILLWCGHVISKLSNMNNIILVQKHRVDYFGCNAFSKTWRTKIYEKVFFVIWHSFKDINRNYMKI